MHEEVRGQVSEVGSLILRKGVAPMISEICTLAYLAWKLLANLPIIAFHLQSAGISGTHHYVWLFIGISG